MKHEVVQDWSIEQCEDRKSRCVTGLLARKLERPKGRMKRPKGRMGRPKGRMERTKGRMERTKRQTGEAKRENQSRATYLCEAL